MRRRKKLLAVILVFALALQSGMPARMLASEADSRRKTLPDVGNEVSDADLDAGDEVSDADLGADDEISDATLDADLDVTSAETKDLTGIQVIDGEFCCFTEDGEIDEKKTNELREAAQAESDITPLLELIGEPDDEEYFGQGCWFGASGRESGEDGTWYYDNFLVYVYKTAKNTYYMGAEASAIQKSDFRSMLESVVEWETGAADSPEVKLKALFRYVEDEYSYARKVGFEPYDGWQEDYAAEMLSDMAGSCYHYAALYAYLAQEATGYEVRICIGTTDGFSATSWQPHAWTEIEIDGKWYVFDANLDKYEADSALKYYMLDTESDLYGEIYRAENVYEVTFGAGQAADGENLADMEQETEQVSEIQTELQTTSEDDTETEPEEEAETVAEDGPKGMAEEEPEAATEPGTENESETETEDESEGTAEEEPEAATEPGTENESETEAEDESEGTAEEEPEAATEHGTENESETEAEDETETTAETETSTELKVDEEGEDVLALDNRTGIAFAEAHLAGDRLTLVDGDGAEHIFSEVDKDDILSPHLVVYGNFLAIKYTSSESGKAGRLTEEGEEIVFDVPQAMTVISTAYVRSGAGLDCSKITVADKGSTIQVIAESGKWFRIALKDGREGYISKIAVIVEEKLPSGGEITGAQETETETEPAPELVVVEEDGKYYRYLRYTPAADTIVEVDGKPCYVTAGGQLLEGWKILDGKLYYSDAEGRLKCSELYKGIRFGRNGAALSSTNTSLKMKVIQIVDSITDDTMTQREKLSACWKYVTRGHISYAGKYPDLNAEGWQRSMALDVLNSGSGNCYGFACAFAALAEEIGYNPEVVCGRVSGSRDGAADGMTRHSWVMIDGCHYDPEAQWAGWCAGIYGYGSYPVAHSVQKVVAF